MSGIKQLDELHSAVLAAADNGYPTDVSDMLARAAVIVMDAMEIALMREQIAELEQRIENMPRLRGSNTPAEQPAAEPPRRRQGPPNSRGRGPQIRAWCAEQGIDVNANGPLPRRVIAAYDAAMGGAA